MRKLIYACLALNLAVFSIPAKADEGMWLPMLLGKNYQDMVQHGLKLSPQQLYDVNHASLKDAIVWFGGGCTGEVISSEGLLITNHHCGYDAIASASDTTHNYLRDGFWAYDKGMEIPAGDLSVSFLISMEDVTEQVLSQIKDVPADQLSAKLQEVYEGITKKAKEGNHYEAFVRDMYKGNQYYLFIMEKFTDIRLVGTPPEAIGKFGGDTDNWMWPRHTGDFSMFRIYADKDNKPAAYSKDNVPYKPKHFLPISIKGVAEGDYAMIFGFPGRTNRYETSYGVQLAIDQTNPAIVKLRTARLELMKEQMDKSDAVRLQLASRYAQIANYWKYFIGQTEQLKHLKVYDQKSNEEQQFQTWATDHNEYAQVLPNLKKAYDDYRPYNLHGTYLREGILGSVLAGFGSSFLDLEKELMKPVIDSAALKKALGNVAMRYKSYFLKFFNAASDQKIMATTLLYFYNDIQKDQHPEFMKTILKKYKEESLEETFAEFAEAVFEKTFLTNPDKMKAFLENPSLKMIQKDPAIQYALAFVKNYNEKYLPLAQAFNTVLMKEGKLYMKGLLEMSPNRMFYPDANSTMRCTYGNVKSYDPKDGVHYKYLTTLSGIMEKEDPNNEEFIVPTKLKELYMKKDFGPYKDASGDVPVGFITNNDITGGNSGSPVINGFGELIGTAFDGNWEAMSGDIAFDSQFKRTICVDIRYVLFIIDKMAGAKNLIQEMKINAQ